MMYVEFVAGPIAHHGAKNPPLPVQHNWDDYSGFDYSQNSVENEIQ